MPIGRPISPSPIKPILRGVAELLTASLLAFRALFRIAREGQQIVADSPMRCGKALQFRRFWGVAAIAASKVRRGVPASRPRLRLGVGEERALAPQQRTVGVRLLPQCGEDNRRESPSENSCASRAARCAVPERWTVRNPPRMSLKRAPEYRPYGIAR